MDKPNNLVHASYSSGAGGLRGGMTLRLYVATQIIAAKMNSINPEQVSDQHIELIFQLTDRLIEMSNERR